MIPLAPNVAYANDAPEDAPELYDIEVTPSLMGVPKTQFQPLQLASYPIHRLQ